MSEASRPSDESLPLSLLMRVDQACRRFEAAWKAGERPVIEDFLEGWDEPGRSELVGELVHLEIHYRRRRGESFAPDGYAARFPTLDRATLEAPARGGPTLMADTTPENEDSVLSPFPGQADKGQGSADGLPFERLGHYRILRRIGRGGMGDVYLGFEDALKRQVAIKVLPAEMTRHADFIRRFHAEAAAAARVIHPNVVPIYYIGRDAGFHFFAMRYVEGESLDRLLARRGRLGVGETLAVLEQCLAGLGAAHRAGLVHRDVKPGNVLLEADGGRALVADFGLVKVTDAQSGVTATGVVMGTVDYIPPEQARGQEADGRSDLYSLGVMAYRMLSGRLPFEAKTPAAMIFRHAYETPRPLAEAAPDVPAPLAALVGKLMAKDPAARHQTSAEALADVRRLRVGSQAVAQTPRPPQTIAAPDLGQQLDLAGGLERIAAGNWWRRLRDRAASLFQAHAPEFVKELQNTSQQVDGAVAEYQRRRDRLAGLVGEAQQVLEELTAQAKSHREAAVAAACRAESASDAEAADKAAKEKAGCEQQADELDRQAVEQRQHLSQIRLNLAKVDATLGRLRVQRDLLQARLRVAQARLNAEGGRLLPRRRWLLVAGILLLVGLGVAGSLFVPAVYHVGANRGQLVVEVDDPNVEVVLGQQGMMVHDRATDRKYTLQPGRQDLPAGSYEIEVTEAAGGLHFSTREFTITRNGQTAVKVTLDQAAPAKAPEEHVGEISAKAPAPEMKVGEVRRIAWKYPEGEVNVINTTFSPDGQWYAAGGDDGRVRIWNVSTGELVREILYSGWVWGLSFTPDGGRLFCTASGDVFPPKLFAVASGRELRQFPGHTAVVQSAAVSPDGKQAVTSSTDQTIRLWDLETGKDLWRIEGPDQYVFPVVVSHDGKLVLCPKDPNTLQLCAVKSGKRLRFLQGHTANVFCCQFTPDDKRIISAARDNTLRVWDAADGKEIRRSNIATLTDVTGVMGGAISRDARFLVTAHMDHTVQVHDVDTGKELCRFVTANTPQGVSISPDGRFAACGSFRGLAYLFRLPDPPAPEKVGEVRRFEGHTSSVRAVAYSPDGRFAVSGTGYPTTDGTIRLWDLTTGKEVRQFDAHEQVRVYSLAFSPDGRRILSAGNDPVVRLWDVNTGEQVRKFEGNTYEVYEVAFSPNGRQVLSAGGDHTTRIWDADTGAEIRRFDGHTRSVTCVAFSADGKRVLSGSHDTTIRLWDVGTGKELKRFIGNEGLVQCVALSPDGRYALSGSGEENTVRLWDVETGKLVREFIGHEGGVLSVAFSADGRRALSGSSDKTLRLWDVETGKELHCFRGHGEAVWNVAFSPDGRHALSGSQDKTVRLWRLPDPPAPENVGEVRRFEGHTSSVRAVAYSPDGRFAVSGTGYPDYTARDGTIRLWDVATGKEVRKLDAPVQVMVHSLAFSPDGRRILLGSEDPAVLLYDVDTGKAVRKLEGAAYNFAVAFSPNGRQVLSGSTDGTTRLWDADTGKEVRKFEGHMRWVVSVAFSPDGRRAASGGNGDGPLRLWDVETGKELKRFEGHSEDGVVVAYSPDGRFLLSGGVDKTVRLWDVETGKEVRSFVGHTGGVNSVAFSPDGRRALSGGLDTMLRLWDVETGKELHCFQGHGDAVCGVAFSPDGHYALSGSQDKTVRLWRLPDPPAPENVGEDKQVKDK